jgi:sugar phosphate isomerase/epimerase
MLRVLSTYLFVAHKLTPSLLAEMERELSRAGGAREDAAGVEIFCQRSHFDYRARDVVREFREWFAEHGLRLHSLHAPTSRDVSASRESAAPISIADLERVRRLDAVDEIKRALEVAESIPCRVLVLHLGGREPLDDRRRDAAFNSLEHLCIFAKQRGVTIALENTPDEMATPWALRQFVEETRLRDLRLCFDAGHAHMGEGVLRSYEVMREMVVTTHLHDNRGERDEHLLPGEGTIDWDAALGAFRDAPAAQNALPLVLELKEPAPAPGVNAAIAPAILLGKVASVFERFARQLGRAA